MKTLILLCSATFGKARRQQFSNYPCLTNLVLVAEVAGRKRLETIERDRKAAMESLCVGLSPGRVFTETERRAWAPFLRKSANST